MSCQTVQNSLSAHLDGCLSREERQELLSHLGQCPDCELRFAQLARVRHVLGELPGACPPSELTSRLRVLASQECARRAAQAHPLRHYRERFRLLVDNLMRPMALPFAGGLISAILLFSMLMPSIALHHNPSLNDVPVALFTEPAVKAQTPFGFGAYDAADFVIEVVVDGQGRMVDYRIAQGQGLAKNPELRRTIENNLLFTEFTPATAFGRPTFGRMYLSFNRSQINVPSGKS